MKCPYRNFSNCIVQEFPSCEYVEAQHKILGGRKPHYMSDEDAIKAGCLWEESKTEYKFVACKLIEAGTQPVPQKKEIINNTSITKVSIKKSIF